MNMLCVLIVSLSLGAGLGHAEDAVKAPPARDEKPMAEVVAEGAMAPEFTLPSEAGEQVSLAQFRGKKSVVLYFYPKDNTPVCTKEAEAFAASKAKLDAAGAVVLGVSVDDSKSHERFAKKLSLNFSLLADEGGKVAKQYGVMGWIMAKRVTFVIDREGRIAKIFRDVSVDTHSKEVVEAVSKIAPAETAASAAGGAAVSPSAKAGKPRPKSK